MMWYMIFVFRTLLKVSLVTKIHFTCLFVLIFFFFFFSVRLVYASIWKHSSTSSPPPNTLLLPPLPLLLPLHSQEQSGFPALWEIQVPLPPSRSRKVSIQTGQDPKKTVHADETRPSAIVNVFSVSPHVSHIQRIRVDHMLVQSQSSWPWWALIRSVPLYQWVNAQFWNCQEDWSLSC